MVHDECFCLCFSVTYCVRFELYPLEMYMGSLFQARSTFLCSEKGIRYVPPRARGGRQVPLSPRSDFRKLAAVGALMSRV